MALANKNARTAWALLANGETYRRPAAVKAELQALGHTVRIMPANYVKP